MYNCNSFSDTSSNIIWNRSGRKADCWTVHRAGTGRPEPRAPRIRPDTKAKPKGREKKKSLKNDWNSVLMGISGSSALARTHPAAGGHIVNLAKREGCNRKRMTSLFIWLAPNYFSYFSSFHWGFLRFIIFSLPFFSICFFFCFFFFFFFFLFILSFLSFFFSFFCFFFLFIRVCVTRCHVSHAAIATSRRNIAHRVLLAFFQKIYKAAMNGHYFNPHYQLMFSLTTEAVRSSDF